MLIYLFLVPQTADFDQRIPQLLRCHLYTVGSACTEGTLCFTVLGSATLRQQLVQSHLPLLVRVRSDQIGVAYLGFASGLDINVRARIINEPVISIPASLFVRRLR